MKMWSKRRKRHFSRCPPSPPTSRVGQRHEIVKKRKRRIQLSPCPNNMSKTSKSGSKTPKSGQTNCHTPFFYMISMSPVTCRTCHVMSHQVIMSCQLVKLSCHVNSSCQLVMSCQLFMSKTDPGVYTCQHSHLWVMSKTSVPTPV